MNLTVNGTTHDVVSPPLTTLLDVLREELMITSPKAGCLQGGCGACTVLVDGQPRRSCLTPLAAVEGAQIGTVEGLGTGDDLSVVQAAFHEHYAAQCGFCTSGFQMATQALVDRGTEITREDVVEEMNGHVCRCTGYVKIIDAVTAAVNGEVSPADDEADMSQGDGDQGNLVRGFVA